MNQWVDKWANERREPNRRGRKEQGEKEEGKSKAEQGNERKDKCGGEVEKQGRWLAGPGPHFSFSSFPPSSGRWRPSSMASRGSSCPSWAPCRGTGPAQAWPPGTSWSAFVLSPSSSPMGPGTASRLTWCVIGRRSRPGPRSSALPCATASASLCPSPASGPWPSLPPSSPSASCSW